MREKELLKITLQGDFNVIKITKTEDGVYLLKQMSANQSPGWRIIEKSSKFSDIEFSISLFRQSCKYILNVSERIRLSDLRNLTDAGFQVLRISPSNKLVIKKFNPLTNSWVKLSSFPKVTLRDDFLVEILYDNRTILID